MKMRILLAAVLLLLTATAHADQGTKKDPFWEMLQSKLEKVVPAKKGATTTAVGGVRGAKNDEATDIYWKGKDKAVVVNEEEIQKFNQAVDTKLKGDNELALKQFEEFISQYPQSNLRVEGLQAAEKIKLELAAAQSAPKVQAVPQSAATPEPAAESQPAK